VCGNYRNNAVAHLGHLGSPPRVRELPPPTRVARRGAGITPACAGITQDLYRQAQRIMDHPRVCGNYVWLSATRRDGAGSPPRVRELLDHYAQIDRLARITPACAGITLPLHKNSILLQDHPRVCGNYHAYPCIEKCYKGSPPRVRELHDTGAQDAGSTRITPACAGIT